LGLGPNDADLQASGPGSSKDKRRESRRRRLRRMSFPGAYVLRRRQREVATRGPVRELQALRVKDFIEVAEEGTSGREEENCPVLPVLEYWVQRQLQWTTWKSRLKRNCRGDLGGISDLEDQWIGSVFREIFG
ncbi:hypothetical protein U1Q18_006483, partial [Sarracenia purpurea var. burkii]